jgi:inosine-uridine nucleoside N-ribohydrolase
MLMARKVVIDLDPGIDDAVALVMALFDPRLEVIAVTAVAGNVPAEHSTRNLQSLIELLDPPRWPRLGAAAADDSPVVDGRHLHGGNGLADAEFACAELHHVAAADKVISDAIRSAPNEVTVVTLGPLTNLARTLQRDPGLVNILGQAVISGGAINVPGNVTPAAEFNFHANPLAARQVLRLPFTKTLVPLNITRQVMLGFDFLEQLPPTDCKAGDLLHRILPYAFRSFRRAYGLEGIYLADAVALLAAADPSAFSTEMMAIDVETQGELTLGATVADLRSARQWRANTGVVTEVDRVPTIDTIVHCLERAGKAG